MRDKLKALAAKFFDRTFLKFILVGVVNTLFGTAIMFGFYNLLHLSYWVSSAANYFFGSILSYFLNKHFTFRNKEKGAGTVVRFVLEISVCYLIAYGAAKPLVRLVLSGASQKLRDNIAMLVGMGLFVILNYIGQRFFAFAERGPAKGETTILEKLKKLNASRWGVLALLALIWAFMLILNLFTPYVADDFAYMISFKTQGWIKSFGDIFPSMAAHARIMNGRLLSHGLGQLFMLWPKTVFDLVNALVFAGTVYMMYLLVKPRDRENVLLLAGVFGAFWLFMPAFGQVALWQLGSVNYLWALCFGLLFLRPYVRWYEAGGDVRTPLWGKLLLCVLALPFGAYTEVMSFIGILLAAALLALGRLVKKASLRTWLWIPIAAAAAGYVVLMAMPAEVNAKGTGMTLVGLLGNFVNATQMLYQYGLALCCVWAAAELYGIFLGVDRDRLVLSAVFALGAVAANYMLTAASYYPERCFYVTGCLLVVAVLTLVPGYMAKGRTALCACAGSALAVAAALVMIIGAADVWNTHHAQSQRVQRIAEAKAAGEETLTVPLIRASTKYSAYWGLTDLDTQAYDAWPNNYISTYYGIWLKGE